MSITIHTGDVLEGLKKIQPDSVQTCITSPPYYGLRDYGTAAWEGGAADCDHTPPVKLRSERPKSGLHSLGYTDACQQPCFRDVCGLCGAIRVDQQIGLEESPEAYVARLVAVFRGVRRVLRDDGTLWVNLGDSYATSSVRQTGRKDQGGACMSSRLGPKQNGLPGNSRIDRTLIHVDSGLKPKDLIGIPWRVAFALQADGWYLRQDIIWAKPNPMPESVRDRCTKAHEYLFLLAKSERYLYDRDAIREPFADDRQGASGAKNLTYSIGSGRRDSLSLSMPQQHPGRNRRSVWTVTPKPFKGAHFATMPPMLIEPCVLAGSRPGDLVLDPFTGSGTTAVVALRHGRRFVGTELNPEFVAMAHRRVAEEAGSADVVPFPVAA